MNDSNNSGKACRRMGHNAERYYAKIFRELGFDRCITSRQGSKMYDDAGIDLMMLPFNVQIKAGKQRGFNPKFTLQDMKEKIHKTFPESDPVCQRPNIVILKKETGKGKKRTPEDELVTMNFNDFVKFLNLKRK